MHAVAAALAYGVVSMKRQRSPACAMACAVHIDQLACWPVVSRAWLVFAFLQACGLTNMCLLQARGVARGPRQAWLG